MPNVKNLERKRHKETIILYSINFLKYTYILYTYILGSFLLILYYAKNIECKTLLFYFENSF